MPGVAAVLTATELDLPSQPPAGNVEGPFGLPSLASSAVRYVGEPIAMVLAGSVAQALDAAEAVGVDSSRSRRSSGSTLPWRRTARCCSPTAGTNLAASFEDGWDDDVLDDAEVVVRVRMVHQRLAPVPMEGNATLAEPGPGGTLTVWVSSQVPFDVRDDVADVLGLDRDAVRVVAPDVGGGFGTKGHVYAE